MITVTIYRAALVREGACAEGLALFDQIAAMQSTLDLRRAKRIKVRWSRLHRVWLAVNHPSFSRWLYEHGLTPEVNLGGADLGGAYLGGAYLGGADLGGAYLRGAYLGGADLGGAYLGGADLGGAYLGGAYLRGADLGEWVREESTGYAKKKGG